MADEKVPESPEEVGKRLSALETKPPKGNGWRDFLDLLAILLGKDNVVIICLTVIVIYAIYTFGSAQATIAKEIILFVGGGFTGYLGNEVKSKLTESKSPGT